ncbi:glycosyl hydrolase family 8 [Sabulicella glaciei]|uniref:cellulase n=1 Tax=Sabulicella glaciei TaxID=2984948 RepID=A0ABT3P0K8_9PROT|nr:glycosyl hydrolase family 8 [Roseococcus sp. MDT2-1-1]MCW8087943.1 glycosyl hydrolase family 8 [Roseococcus sp. MDT2-1-1]
MASLPVWAALSGPALGRPDRGDSRAGTDRVPRSEWSAFQSRYMTPEGRVVDTAKAHISHSEGQSYAMLLAVHMEDRAAFDLAWDWARLHLHRRGDHLLSWRWDPHARPHVADPNNASDGDLVAAWALARAAALWREPSYREQARRIARDLLRLCTVEWNNRLLLLPGAHGFRFHDRVVINLSYYSWAAMRGLSRVLPSPAWSRLEADGLALLEQARFGRFALPPDWLELGARGAMRPAPGWPPRFSWDAVRIPLHLVWAGRGTEALLPRVERFWSAQRRRDGTPAWADLESGDLAPYPGHAGLRAVARASRHALGLPAGPPESVADATDYYGAALVLLSRVAATDAAAPATAGALPAPPAEVSVPGTQVAGAGEAQATPTASWRGRVEAVAPDGLPSSLPLGLRVGPPLWTPSAP